MDTRILTRQELSDRVASGDRDVAAAASRLTQGQNLFEREMAFVPEGLSDAGRREYKAAREKAHLPALEIAERDALKIADRIAAAVQPVLTQTHGAERALSPADMATAGTLLPMLQHEADTLPLPELLRRVQAAVRNGDAVRLHVYGEVLPARLRAQSGNGQAAADAAPALTADGVAKAAWPDGGPEDQEATDELRRLVVEIRAARRDTSFDTLRADAVAVLEKLDALRRAARQRERDEAGAGTTWNGVPKTAWPARG